MAWLCLVCLEIYLLSEADKIFEANGLVLFRKLPVRDTREMDLTIFYFNCTNIMLSIINLFSISCSLSPPPFSGPSCPFIIRSCSGIQTRCQLNMWQRESFCGFKILPLFSTIQSKILKMHLVKDAEFFKKRLSWSFLLLGGWSCTALLNCSEKTKQKPQVCADVCCFPFWNGYYLTAWKALWFWIKYHFSSKEGGEGGGIQPSFHSQHCTQS